jgi:hypothetical protein
MTLYENYPIHVYSDSTLKGMTKETLIGEIRCLENNLASAYKMNDVQAGYIDFFCKNCSNELLSRFIHEGGKYVVEKEGDLIFG